MITFVYCCICLLIVFCQTTRPESEENDFNNYSPDTSPILDTKQYRIGANIVLNCGGNNHYLNTDNIIWEFKRCDSNYKGIQCDSKSMYNLDYSEGQWKKLDYNRRRKKLQIKNATEESVGLYRCLSNDSIIKIFMLDLQGTSHLAHPPELLSLEPSPNTTFTRNTLVVLQCRAKSKIPPEIRWFKECDCGVVPRLSYHNHCYCGPLPQRNSVQNKSHNVYVSKFSIYNLQSVDTGTYVCLIITQYGEDHKNITIQMSDTNSDDNSENSSNSFSLLFLIPLFFVLVPIFIWLGFYRRKKKNRREISEHQKQLIKRVVEL